MILLNELAHQNPFKVNTSKPTTLPFWVFSYKMLRWWGLLQIQKCPFITIYKQVAPYQNEKEISTGIHIALSFLLSLLNLFRGLCRLPSPGFMNMYMSTLVIVLFFLLCIVFWAGNALAVLKCPVYYIYYPNWIFCHHSPSAPGPERSWPCSTGANVGTSPRPWRSQWDLPPKPLKSTRPWKDLAAATPSSILGLGKNEAWQWRSRWDEKGMVIKCIFLAQSASTSPGAIQSHFLELAPTAWHHLRQTSIIFRHLKFPMAHRWSKRPNSEGGNLNICIFIYLFIYFFYLIYLFTMHLIKLCFPKSDIHIAVRTIILRMAHQFHGISNMQTWMWSTLYSYGFFDKFYYMPTNPFIHLPMAQGWSDRLSFFHVIFLWFWFLPHGFRPFHKSLGSLPKSEIKIWETDPLSLLTNSLVATRFRILFPTVNSQGLSAVEQKRNQGRQASEETKGE